MSECSARPRPVIARNHVRSLGGSRLARVLHDLRPTVVLLAILLAAPLAGCVIPPSLSVDNQDAGINSPPVVLAVRGELDDLDELGKVSFVQGEQGSLSVELLDTDLQDTLYVRVFVNYTFDDPKPPRSTCTAAPTGEPKRTVSCDTTAICGASDVSATQLHDLQVKVFDRPLLESGTPLFQNVDDGGLSSSKVFHLQCMPRT